MRFDGRPSVVATAYALILKQHAAWRPLDAKRAAEALEALRRVWPDFVAIAEDEYNQTVSAEGGMIWTSRKS